MNLTPVTALFTRSLMLRTRAPSVAWMRLALGAVLLLILIDIDRRHGAVGRALLEIIAYVSVWALAIPALTSFAGAIAEEKEENGLGLLRLAGLHPLGILLAKSTARLLEAMVLMAITLPIALLAVTLGGVTAVQVLAVYVALGTWLVLLANLAVFWSVVCRTSASASAATILSLIFVPLGFGLLLLVTGDRHSPLLPCGRWLWEMTVITRLQEVLRTGYDGQVAGISDLAHLAVGAALFLAAWRLFPSCAVDAEGGLGERPLLASSTRGRSLPARLLGAGRAPQGLAALTWKDFHFLGGGRLGQLLWLLSFLGMGAMFLWVTGPSRLSAVAVSSFMQITALVVLPLQTGLLLGRLFSEERRSLTIGGILVLPYAPAAMLYAKLRAVSWTLLPTAGLFAAGVLVSPRTFANGCEEFFQHGFGLAAIAMVLAFWHWCAYLSMRLMSGAFIVAVALIVGTVMILVFFSGVIGSRYAMEVLMTVVYGLQALVVHLLMRERFRRLAAD